MAPKPATLFAMYNTPEKLLGGPDSLIDGSTKGSRPIQPLQFVCFVCLHVNNPGTSDTHTGCPDPRSARSGRCTFWCRRQKQELSGVLPVWRLGPLQKPVPKQTTPWPSGKRPGPAMMSACQLPASILMPLRGPFTLRRSWKTYYSPYMGYGSYSRAARHIAEASTLGVLVFASSSRQETQPRETFGKAAHAQRDTATSLPVRISTRKPRNQRSFKVLPARKQPRCTLQYGE
ncbi:hypothetical protein MRX96_039679 [Rhipicephalus microplus]